MAREDISVRESLRFLESGAIRQQAALLQSSHGASRGSEPSPRRRRHGLQQRLGHPARRHRDSRRVRRLARGARGLGAPHARRHVRLCRGGRRRAGCKAIIAGAGGAAHLPGMLAAKTTRAGARRAGGQPAPAGRGFAALDRADAQGHSGGHLRHRRGRRGQRGAVRGGDARQRRPGAARAARRLPRTPDRGRARDDGRTADGSVDVTTSPAPFIAPGRHARRDGRRPARPHVRARGAAAWATSPRCSIPTRPARPAWWRTTTSRPATSTSRAWRS